MHKHAQVSARGLTWEDINKSVLWFVDVLERTGKPVRVCLIDEQPLGGGGGRHIA